MRLHDVPSVAHVNSYLPQPMREEPADDHWSYEWDDRCLWCGLTGNQRDLPAGAIEIQYADEMPHLETELARFLEAGGSNPTTEPYWRDAIAAEYGRADNWTEAFTQIEHGMELLKRELTVDDRALWWRFAVTLPHYAKTDELRMRALARLEPATAAAAPGNDLAMLLLQLANLHAGLRDWEAAWGAATNALEIFRAGGDAEAGGHGIANVGCELISLGAVLGRDTSAIEAQVRKFWGPTFGDTLDAMISAKKAHYR